MWNMTGWYWPPHIEQSLPRVKLVKPGYAAVDSRFTSGKLSPATTVEPGAYYISSVPTLPTCTEPEERLAVVRFIKSYKAEDGEQVVALRTAGTASTKIQFEYLRDFQRRRPIRVEIEE